MDPETTRHRVWLFDPRHTSRPTLRYALALGLVSAGLALYLLVTSGYRLDTVFAAWVLAASLCGPPLLALIWDWARLRRAGGWLQVSGRWLCFEPDQPRRCPRVELALVDLRGVGHRDREIILRGRAGKILCMRAARGAAEDLADHLQARMHTDAEPQAEMPRPEIHSNLPVLGRILLVPVPAMVYIWGEHDYEPGAEFTLLLVLALLGMLRGRALHGGGDGGRRALRVSLGWPALVCGLAVAAYTCWRSEQRMAAYTPEFLSQWAQGLGTPVEILRWGHLSWWATFTGMMLADLGWPAWRARVLGWLASRWTALGGWALLPAWYLLYLLSALRPRSLGFELGLGAALGALGLWGLLRRRPGSVEPEHRHPVGPGPEQ